MLMIQVAVPREVAGRNKLLEFAIDALHGANAIAFDIFNEKGIVYPLDKAENLINKVARLTAAKIGVWSNSEET